VSGRHLTASDDPLCCKRDGEQEPNRTLKTFANTKEKWVELPKKRGRNKDTAADSERENPS